MKNLLEYFLISLFTIIIAPLLFLLIAIFLVIVLIVSVVGIVISPVLFILSLIFPNQLANLITIKMKKTTTTGDLK